MADKQRTGGRELFEPIKQKLFTDVGQLAEYGLPRFLKELDRLFVVENGVLYVPLILGYHCEDFKYASKHGFVNDWKLEALKPYSVDDELRVRSFLEAMRIIERKQVERKETGRFAGSIWLRGIEPCRDRPSSDILSIFFGLKQKNKIASGLAYSLDISLHTGDASRSIEAGYSTKVSSTSLPWWESIMNAHLGPNVTDAR